MGDPITPASAWTTLATGPNPGDDVKAADVRDLGQALMDRTEWTYDNVPVNGTYDIPAATNFVRLLKGPRINALTGEAKLGPVSVAVGETYYMTVDLPVGATIKNVRSYVDPSNHGGLTPDQKIRMILTTYAPSAFPGSPTAYLTTTDPATGFSGSGYDAQHSFDISVADDVDLDVTSTSEVYLYLVGESGANAQSVLWHGVLINFELDAFDPGGK